MREINNHCDLCNIHESSRTQWRCTWLLLQWRPSALRWLFVLHPPHLCLQRSETIYKTKNRPTLVNFKHFVEYLPYKRIRGILPNNKMSLYWYKFVRMNDKKDWKRYNFIFKGHNTTELKSATKFIRLLTVLYVSSLLVPAAKAMRKSIKTISDDITPIATPFKNGCRLLCREISLLAYKSVSKCLICVDGLI